jgi:hypothetical protein
MEGLHASRSPLEVIPLIAVVYIESCGKMITSNELEKYNRKSYQF